MLFKKILVGVDFSGVSHEALRVAADLAAQPDAELAVVHVWQPPMYSFASDVPFPSDILEELVGSTEKQLDAWTAEAKELGARRATGALLTGVPWDQIVETLRRDPTYDLAVVGTHGRTGLRHVLLGSVAEKIVRHAPCAVMVVRPRP